MHVVLLQTVSAMVPDSAFSEGVCEVFWSSF